MKHRIIFLTLVAIIFVFSCEDDKAVTNDNQSIDETVFTQKADITKMLIEKTLSEGDDGLDWRSFSDEQLWAAFQYSNNTVSVGWREDSSSDYEKEIILDYVKQTEGLSSDDSDGGVVELDDLNALVLKIEKKETLIGLKEMVDVIEEFEIGYEIFSEEEVNELFNINTTVGHKKFGVGPEEDISSTGLLDEKIYYPSRFDYHNIKSAWNNGLTGKNIGIAVVDAGITSGHDFFGKNKNYNGENPSFLERSLKRHGFHKWCYWCWWTGYDGVWDTYNMKHGEHMLQIAGGPMAIDNEQKLTTGVAFASNLRSVRSSPIVWLGLYKNVVGVARSFTFLSKKSDVNIVSMSQGRILYSWLMRRAIRRLTKKGKLVFTAAGTVGDGFTDFVLELVGKDRKFTLYPARESEVIACTGVNVNATDWCGACHGRADFITSFADGFGSSSESTATTAGIAALIWSQDPGKSARKVKEEMISISEFGNNRKGWKGHGRLFLDRYKGSSSKLVHIRKRNVQNYAIDGSGSSHNGQNVYLWSANPNNKNQQWVEIDRGEGFYSYKKRYTDYCIDGNWGGKNRQNIHLWRCDPNNPNQQWKKLHKGNNFFSLIKKGTEHAIDGNSNGSNGQNIYLWKNNGNHNHQWRIDVIQ